MVIFFRWNGLFPVINPLCGRITPIFYPNASYSVYLPADPGEPAGADGADGREAQGNVPSLDFVPVRGLGVAVPGSCNSGGRGVWQGAPAIRLLHEPTAVTSDIALKVTRCWCGRGGGRA